MKPEIARYLAKRRPDPWQSIRDDVAPYRAMSLEERGRCLSEVCRAAWTILKSRPDWEKVRDHQVSPPPSYFAAMARLRQEFRARG